MGFNMWIIFASLLLISVGANRYDQGPQKFYDVSSDTETAEQNENKEVIVYLTPEQVKALEEGGAVVQSAIDSEEENNEEDPELLYVPPVTEEQEEDVDNIESQEEKQAQQEEENRSEDNLSRHIDFEAILRLLNEEQVSEEESLKEQARNESEVEEENTEKPRIFSPRLTLKQQQPPKEQKNAGPAAAKKEEILKTYSYIRYQPDQQPQRINIQLLREEIENKSTEESDQESEATPAVQEKRKYKLVPVESEESSEEPIQEENDQQEASQAEVVAPTAGKNKILQDELESILREIKSSPKYNNQKYAIEIERLRNLENQKAQEKAANITKTVPALIRQQLIKKRIQNKNKQGKALSGLDSRQAKPQQPRKSSAPVENPKSIAVPVLNVENPDAQKPIRAPVEIPKVLSVKNVYVKTRTDKPYIVSRRVPDNKKQNPSEPSKPERITILRHIWEQ